MMKRKVSVQIVAVFLIKQHKRETQNDSVYLNTNNTRKRET